MDDLPALPPGTGVMLCGHGSRNQLAVGEFADLTDDLRARLPGVPIEYGYLEFADPVIHHGLDKLRAQGLTRILAVPGMLFAAGHAKNDIPSVLNTYAAAHPGHRDHLWPRARRRSQDAARRRRPHRGRPPRLAAQDSAHRDAAARRRPRRLRPRRQRQRRQGHAHALGGHGLRLGRGRLFRRHLPAGRRRRSSMRQSSATAASSSSRTSSSPACW